MITSSSYEIYFEVYSAKYTSRHRIEQAPCIENNSYPYLNNRSQTSAIFSVREFHFNPFFVLFLIFIPFHAILIYSIY